MLTVHFGVGLRVDNSVRDHFDANHSVNGPCHSDTDRARTTAEIQKGGLFVFIDIAPLCAFGIQQLRRRRVDLKKRATRDSKPNQIRCKQHAKLLANSMCVRLVIVLPAAEQLLIHVTVAEEGFRHAFLGKAI